MTSDINTRQETHKGGILQANSHINIDAVPKQDISKTFLIMYLKDQIEFSSAMQNLIHHF